MTTFSTNRDVRPPAAVPKALVLDDVAATSRFYESCKFLEFLECGLRSVTPAWTIRTNRYRGRPLLGLHPLCFSVGESCRTFFPFVSVNWLL